MRAVRIHRHGGPDVLQLDDVEVPQPSPTQVLVKVEAAGVTFGDIMKRRGALGRIDEPAGIGLEIAGTISDIGRDVHGLSLGQRVAGLTDHGYAEFAILDAAAVVPVPDTIPLNTAAAIPVHGMTAYQTLVEAGRLEHGQTVLIHAAAGGVGSLAVQLAKLLGAGTVIATVGSVNRVAHVLASGADAAVDYSSQDWTDEVRALTDGRGVDLVLESVGGDIARQTLECVAPFSTIVSFGAASGTPALVSSTSLMATNSTLVGYSLTGWLTRPDRTRRAVGEMLRHLVEGTLRVPISGSYGLAEVAAAHAAIENRAVNGKVIVVP